MPRFHPQVRRDVTTAIRHDDSISDALGDDFWTKFEQACLQVESYPERVHFDPSGWCREAAPFNKMQCTESTLANFIGQDSD